jgi:hypothetical protein
MADDDEERQRRRLEAKREYNRVLSAQKRQQTKDEITALAAKAEFHADRADKLETKNRQLLQQIDLLTTERQWLSDRLRQQLTTATTGDVGLVPAGQPLANASLQRNAMAGGGGDRPALAIATWGTRTTTGAPPRNTSLDERYNMHLTGLLSGTVGTSNGDGGGSSSSGFDSVLGVRVSRSSATLPGREQQSLLQPGQLHASTFNQNDTILHTARQQQHHPLNAQELDLLIRLNSNSAMMMPGTRHHSRGTTSDSASASIAIPASSSALTEDAESLILAHILATTAQAASSSPSSSSSSYRETLLSSMIPAAADSDIIQRAASQQVLLNHAQQSSSSLSHLTGWQSGGFPAVGRFLHHQQLDDDVNNNNRHGAASDAAPLGGGQINNIAGRGDQQQQQHQLWMIMSLLERIKNQRGSG